MIYYIYKVRRKQTSIHFSRSALPHRYLRYISWISWNDHRPQPSTSWVSTCAPPRVASCAPAYDEVPHPAALLLLLSPSRRERKYLLVFSREKEKHLSSFFPHISHAPLLLCRSTHGPRVPLRGPSAAGPPSASHVVFCGPPTNKKCGPAALRREPAHHKKCRLLAQENTRRHAWLSRSCFGRKNLFIDGPRSLPSFFLSPFLQRKRKKKTEANSAGSNTSLGLTSFVLTMYAIGPSRLVR